METYPAGWFDLSAEKYADLGTMLYLAGLAGTHRHRTLAQAIYSFETPLRLGQYRIFREKGFPRGFVTFGGLSPDAEHNLAVEGKHIRDSDFTSGSSFWILDMVAPFGQVRQIVDILKRDIPHKRVRTNRMDSDLTSPRVVEWTRDEQGKVHMRLYRRKDFLRALIAEGWSDGAASPG
ncbi:MAG: toxin-activating lysine-acyltransferase [Pseudomonadota bacterium]